MGFYDPMWAVNDRLAAIERKLADLSLGQIWQPIISCSTSNSTDVELRFADGSTKTGHFSPSAGRWVVKTDIGYGPLEGLYPTHWREPHAALTDKQTP